MTFAELSESFYEDLNGHISRIESISDDCYTIFLECDDWDDLDQRRRFCLNFKDVAETDCDTGFCGDICCAEDHMLLWNHNHPHESVYFSSAPANPAEVLGRVYTAHKKLFAGWRAMDAYWHADLEILRTGHGMLFRGPRPVAEAYCQAIEGLLKYSRVEDYTPKGGYSAYILEDNFVIAKSVGVIEATANKRMESNG